MRERERDGDQHGLYAVNEKYCQAAGPETTRETHQCGEKKILLLGFCGFCLEFQFRISDDITHAVIGKT